MRVNKKNSFTNFHKIFPNILTKKINKNIKKGSILKLNDFKKK